MCASGHDSLRKHMYECVCVRECVLTCTHQAWRKNTFRSCHFFYRSHLLIFKKSSGGYTACALQKEAGRISVQRTQTLESSKDLLNVFVGQNPKCVRWEKFLQVGGVPACLLIVVNLSTFFPVYQDFTLQNHSQCALNCGTFKLTTSQSAA